MRAPIRFSPESEETFETSKEQLLARCGEAFVANFFMPYFIPDKVYVPQGPV